MIKAKFRYIHYASCVRYCLYCLAGLLILLSLTVNLSALSESSAVSEDGQYMVCLSCGDGAEDIQGRKNIIAVSETELEEYINQGVVDWYEPNYEVTLLSDNWNLDAINCDFNWEIGCYGNGVRVAVIDSGLSESGRASVNYAEGYNYIDKNTDVSDYLGHGTFVCGIIGSESYGVASCAQIVALKCFDEYGSTRISYIAQAIYDAVDKYSCRVINMSFGMENKSETMKAAVEYAAEKGAILVAAAGNNGAVNLMYPAAFDCVIGVGAVNSSLNVSSFSQHNSSVFVTAPGQGLNSLRTRDHAEVNDYSDYPKTKTSGTSFAAPHVVAVAAAALNIREDLTLDEFKELLATTSIDRGTEGYDTYYGYGVIDSEALMKKLLEDTELFISPTRINSEQELCISVYSNLTEDVQLTMLCASYKANGRLKSIQSAAALLKSGGAVSMTYKATEGATKFFLTDSITFSPISKYVPYESIK